MPDTLVRPIEKATPTIEVNRRPARQTNQPVRRRIVGPLSLHRTTRIPIAKPNLVTKPGIETELAEVRKAFRIYQSTNNRTSVYIYLSRVFALVTRWQRLGRALQNARAALRLRPNPPQMKPEPFAIVTFCTADPKIVDDKTRSKWSRVLRYAARMKPEGQRLIDFIKSNGGINECARKFAQPGRRP